MFCSLIFNFLISTWKWCKKHRNVVCNKLKLLSLSFVSKLISQNILKNQKWWCLHDCENVGLCIQEKMIVYWWCYPASLSVSILISENRTWPRWDSNQTTLGFTHRGVDVYSGSDLHLHLNTWHRKRPHILMTVECWTKLYNRTWLCYCTNHRIRTVES